MYELVDSSELGGQIAEQVIDPYLLSLPTEGLLSSETTLLQSGCEELAFGIPQQDTQHLDERQLEWEGDSFDWDQNCVLHSHEVPVAFRECPFNQDQDQATNTMEGPSEDPFAKSLQPLGTPLPTWSSPHPEFTIAKSRPRPTNHSRSSPSASVSRTRRRPAKSTDTFKRRPVKCQAPGCPKNFVPSPENDGRRCSRCYKKLFKSSVGPPAYLFDSSTIGSFARAWTHVYPDTPRMRYERPEGTDDIDDWEAFDVPASEDEWVDRFIEAANMPYTESDGPRGQDKHDTGQRERSYEAHEYFLKQQDTYNKKPYHDASREYYNNLEVNVRMRFLFRAIVTFHAGGQAVYPTGGDNRGYGEDRTMTCSQRLACVAGILATDKRVVMNVIEGRGVGALAANPKKYAERKTQNKSSNETKRRLIAKGEEVNLDSGSGGWSSGRRRKRKRMDSVLEEGGEVELADGEEDEKRRHRGNLMDMDEDPNWEPGMI